LSNRAAGEQTLFGGFSHLVRFFRVKTLFPSNILDIVTSRISSPPVSGQRVCCLDGTVSAPILEPIQKIRAITARCCNTDFSTIPKHLAGSKTFAVGHRFNSIQSLT
jgi:hypothetical protein